MNSSLTASLSRPSSCASEVRVGHADPVGLKALEEVRPHAGGTEFAVDDAGGVGVILFEPEDFLDLDVLAVHAGDLANAGHLAVSVRQSLQLNDDVDGGSDLAADAGEIGQDAGHGHHLLETPQ